MTMGGLRMQRAHVGGATDRATFQDVPPEWAVGGLLSQLQKVVQNHLANEIMPRETVKVIDAEMQLALCQLGQRYRELECLVEDRVQCLPVHLGVEAETDRMSTGVVP